MDTRFQTTIARRTRLLCATLVLSSVSMQLLLFLSLLLVCTGTTAAKVVVFGSDHDFPPYEYLDSKGEPQGFNVDMVRAIGEVMDLDIRVELGPWTEIRRRLEVERTVDISDMFYSERRAEIVEFSQPFGIMYDQFYARRDSTGRCSLDSLSGMEIVAEAGSFTHEYLVERGGATVIAAPSEPDALRLLAAGKHHCALVTQTVGEESIRRYRLTNLAPTGPPILPRNYSLVVRKGETELLDDINQGLVIIKATGRFSEIYDKWFGQSRRHTNDFWTIMQYFGWVFVPMLFVVSGVLAWNRTLRNRVAEHTAALQTELAERRRAEAELEYIAQHDPLTGLPNRHVLYSEVEKRIRSSEREKSFTLLLLDLDRFKEVNDTLGHQSGDYLLNQVGERLAPCLGSNDVLARMGGDEFAILKSPAMTPTETREFAQDLIGRLDSAFEVAGIRLQVGVSIGVAHYPLHGDDASSLMRRADVAMYVSKREASGFAVYDASRDIHNPERLALMAEIKDAISRQQLVLHYQPKFDLADGSLAGVEALVRWQHVSRGLIYPDSFIQFVEMSDLIRPFTLWVVEHAMIQGRAWGRAGHRLPVSVNISARNLLDRELTGSIREILGQHEVEASLLELEITETAIMVDPVRARETLRSIADIGVAISIDDFGIGYSSLSYLQKLPVDYLKIDRSFVTNMLNDPSAREIVTSVIGLAHSLELKVIAEGVDDRQTHQALREMGCDLAQGYYYGRPVPALDLKLAP